MTRSSTSPRVQSRRPARSRSTDSEWRSYRVVVDFRVPLRFAYQWCTDYGPDDPKYSGEDRSIHLERRILENSPRRVVFENLYDEGGGWAWERCVVTLRPPGRWHCECRGNYLESILDYVLTATATDRSRLDMRWHSRPVGRMAGGPPPPHVVEGLVARLWRRRRAAMEEEFREISARRRHK